MIPLPSDAVDYDILCSASLYNELNLLNPNHDSSFQDEKEPHFTTGLYNNVDDLGLGFDDYSTDGDKRTFDFEQAYLDTFFGFPRSDIDGDLPCINPVEVFVDCRPKEQETSKGYIGSSASPAYIADHDHCYSIITKQSDFEISPSPSVSSESPSEVSSSEEEVDVITIPTEPKEQFLVAVPTHETPTKKVRGKRRRSHNKKAVMTQIALSKSHKAPVQRIQVRGAQSRQKNSPGSSPFCSDDDSVKRKEHNYSERQRRRDQQNLLQTLRKTVPDLENVAKAPKVRILDCATRLIRTLQNDEKSLIEEKSSLQKIGGELSKKLKKLKQCRKSVKSIKFSQFL